jgi:hypothetical protein
MTSSNPATSSQLKDIASPNAADACKKTAHRCQSILEHLYDSYHGFMACTEDCKEITLKTHFQTVATIRFDFIDQLSSFVRSEFGLEPWVLSLFLSTIFQLHLEWHRGRVLQRPIRCGSTPRPGSLTVKTEQWSSPKFTVARHISFNNT